MKTRLIEPTDGIYPARDYAHGIQIEDMRKLIFTAGTMGLTPDFRPPETLEEQLTLVWQNLSRILAAADMTLDDIIRVTSYLRRADYAAANRDARLAALGGRRIPTTAIVAETLEPGWMIEIEAIAAA
ncbi:RidA family protein [Nisaea sediminum]|uniref:RidA family protein n=1 Tax=Nisaea sediminum TaxID=2775867 RepID=UPI00186675FB|nr:RidA family protein [Nisaea sediminum]